MKKLLAFALAGLLVISCGTASRTASNTEANTPEAIQNRLQEMGNIHPDGFTVDVRTMEEPKEGISVSYAGTRGARTRRDISGVAAHAISHDGYVGGRKDARTGNLYYTSVKLFPEDRLQDALEFAKENGQMTVLVISTGQEIPVSTAEKSAANGND